MRKKSDICGKKLHEMTPENVYVVPTTKQRYCKACLKNRRNKPKLDKIEAEPSTVFNVVLPKSVWQPFAVACITWDKDPTETIVKLMGKYVEEING